MTRLHVACDECEGGGVLGVMSAHGDQLEKRCSRCGGTGKQPATLKDVAHELVQDEINDCVAHEVIEARLESEEWPTVYQVQRAGWLLEERMSHARACELRTLMLNDVVDRMADEDECAIDDERYADA